MPPSARTNPWSRCVWLLHAGKAAFTPSSAMLARSVPGRCCLWVLIWFHSMHAAISVEAAACALILLVLPCRILLFQKPSSARSSLQMLETSGSLGTEQLGQLQTQHTRLPLRRRQGRRPRHRPTSSVLQGLTSQMLVIAAACPFWRSEVPSCNALHFGSILSDHLATHHYYTSRVHACQQRQQATQAPANLTELMSLLPCIRPVWCCSVYGS